MKNNTELYRDPKQIKFYHKYFSFFCVSSIISDNITGLPIPFKQGFIFSNSLHYPRPKSFFNKSIISELPYHNEKCTLGMSDDGFVCIRLFIYEKSIFKLSSIKEILEKILFFSNQGIIHDIKTKNELFNFALYLNDRNLKNPLKEEIINKLVNEVYNNQSEYIPKVEKRVSIINEEFYSDLPFNKKMSKPNLIRTEIRKIRAEHNKGIIMDKLGAVISSMVENNININKSSISRVLLKEMPQFKNENSIRNILNKILSVEENSTPPQENINVHKLHLTGKGYYTGKMQLTDIWKKLMGGKQKTAGDKVSKVITDLIKQGKPISISILVKTGLNKTTVKKYYKNYKTIIMKHHKKIRAEQTRQIIMDNLPDVISKMEEQKQIINIRSIAKELLSGFPSYSNFNSIRNILTDLISSQEIFLPLLHLMGDRQKPAQERMKATINQFITDNKRISQRELIKSGLNKRTVERYYKLFKQKIMEHNKKINIKNVEDTDSLYFSDGTPIPEFTYNKDEVILPLIILPPPISVVQSIESNLWERNAKDRLIKEAYGKLCGNLNVDKNTFFIRTLKKCISELEFEGLTLEEIIEQINKMVMVEKNAELEDDLDFFNLLRKSRKYISNYHLNKLTLPN